MKNIVILLLLFSSCTTQRQKYLNEFKKDVNSSIFEKFPISDQEIYNNEDLRILFPAGMDAIDYCGFSIVVPISNDIFEKEMNTLNSKYKKVLITKNISNLSINLGDNSTQEQKILDTLLVPKPFQEKIFTAFLIDSKSGVFSKYSSSNINHAHGYFIMVLVNKVDLQCMYLMKIY